MPEGSKYRLLGQGEERWAAFTPEQRDQIVDEPALIPLRDTPTSFWTLRVSIRRRPVVHMRRLLTTFGEFRQAFTEWEAR